MAQVIDRIRRRAVITGIAGGFGDMGDLLGTRLMTDTVLGSDAMFSVGVTLGAGTTVGALLDVGSTLGGVAGATFDAADDPTTPAPESSATEIAKAASTGALTMSPR
jgi:hypothetical protein